MTLVVKRQAKNNVATQAVWASLMDWKLSLWTDRTQKEAARNPFLKININRDAAIADIGEATNNYATKFVKPEASFDWQAWIP